MMKTEYALSSGDVSVLMRESMAELRSRIEDAELVTPYELGVMLASCLNVTLINSDLSQAEHQSLWQELSTGFFDYSADRASGFVQNPSVITGSGLRCPH